MSDLGGEFYDTNIVINDTQQSQKQFIQQMTSFEDQNIFENQGLEVKKKIPSLKRVMSQQPDTDKKGKADNESTIHDIK